MALRLTCLRKEHCLVSTGASRAQKKLLGAGIQRRRHSSACSGALEAQRKAVWSQNPKCLRRGFSTAGAEV